MKIRPRVYILSLLGILLYFCFTFARWQPSIQAGDYYQFWTVTQAIEEGSNTNIYGAADREKIDTAEYQRVLQSKSSAGSNSGFIWNPHVLSTGTPFYYAVFKLISTGRFDFDCRVYRFLSLLFQIGGIVILAWQMGFPPQAWLIAVILFTQFFWPSENNLALGNTNGLQLGWVALYVWLSHSEKSAKRNFLAGALWGMGTLFKPNLMYTTVLLAGGWLLAHRVKKLVWQGAGCVAGVAVALVAPHFILGPGCRWADWPSTFDSMTLQAHWVRDSLPSIISGSLDLRFHFSLLIFLILLTLFLFHRSQFCSVRDPSFFFFADCTLLGLGMALSIVASPYVHGHYFILLIPLFLVSFHPAPPQRKWMWLRRAAAATAFLFIALHPVALWHTNSTTINPNHLWNYAGALLLYFSLAIPDKCRVSSGHDSTAHPQAR